MSSFKELPIARCMHKRTINSGLRTPDKEQQSTIDSGLIKYQTKEGERIVDEGGGSGLHT